ncbi:MAG: mandelate racemase/muconate lactonizing enzyme family protein [Dehalococcoidia bacterium]|nr:mandelate racemase/muconate lactonizing enzyme family protein [Dehalococcoidia bacterium]
MNIKSIKVIPLGYQKDIPVISRAFALARIETDSGIIGWGEASTSYGHFYPTVMKTMVDDILTPALLGKDPLQIRLRKKEMERYLYPWLGVNGISAQVIGAMETALWDIKGRALGVPVHELLGGAVVDATPLYMTGSTFPEKDAAWHGQFFDQALELGFVGVKTRIASGAAKDMEQVEGVREHIGPDIKLMVDAYCNYGVESAIRISRHMGDLDVFWFEEPIPQTWIKGLARLAAASPVSIAVGERVYSVHHFEELADYRAADYWQPDVTVCGGLLDCLEVVGMAKANDIRVFPHIGGLTAVGQAANMHFASMVDEVILEYDGSEYQPLRDDILKDPIFDLDHVKDGKLAIPDGPGLGIEIDESKFEDYPYIPGNIYPDIYPQLGSGTL